MYILGPCHGMSSLSTAVADTLRIAPLSATNPPDSSLKLHTFLLFSSRRLLSNADVRQFMTRSVSGLPHDRSPNLVGLDVPRSPLRTLLSNLAQRPPLLGTFLEELQSSACRVYTGKHPVRSKVPAAQTPAVMLCTTYRECRGTQPNLRLYRPHCFCRTCILGFVV
jgi:hypothetical protein